jgi:8-oxo-dGTP pyrophosphatase MutT (NUDIX family)/GNAT superfamily N-acetyltransferase
MATKYWLAKDGLKIPHHKDPARPEWDKGYLNSITKVFANGDTRRLKPVKIPVTESIAGHFVPDKAVGQGGRNRAPLYLRMLKGGDRLPPAVVRRNGISWSVIDGNARLKAALKHGLKEMDAYELVDPPKDPIKKSETKRKVASVAVFDSDKKLLFGKRKDNGKWSMPGGHLNEGEEPLEGAKRELFEETGLKSNNFEYLGENTVRDVLIYAYKCTIDKKPTTINDPDKEFTEFQWVNSDKLPENIANNLHSPKNVTLQLLGLQDWDELAKMAIKDIAPGTPTVDAEGPATDYSHVLPENTRKDYSIKVSKQGGDYRADLTHKGEHAGYLDAYELAEPHHLQVHDTSLEDDHRGKGLGTALYEALYAHALQNGIHTVHGGIHGSLAGYVHEKLARKHGIKYHAAHRESKSPINTDYDARRGPYQYKID